MSVSLYEQFLSVGSVRSLMTGKDFSDSSAELDEKKENDEEKPSLKKKNSASDSAETA